MVRGDIMYRKDVLPFVLEGAEVVKVYFNMRKRQIRRKVGW